MDEENIAGVPLPPPQESISNPASSLAASGLATSPHATSPLATMLLEAAARFVDLPAAEFDQVISQTLDQLATYVEMEHVGLSLIQQSQLQVSVERRYVAGGYLFALRRRVGHTLSLVCRATEPGSFDHLAQWPGRFTR